MTNDNTAETYRVCWWNSLTGEMVNDLRTHDRAEAFSRARELREEFKQAFIYDSKGRGVR